MKKIEFEMVPENMWYCNLRHILKKHQWDIIRKDAYKRYEYKCACCGRKVKRLEGHELWEYNEDTKTQKLKDVVALCKLCHLTIHIGQAGLLGKTEDCFANYCRINKCNLLECINDYNNAIEIWEKRNKINWKLDISWINKYFN